MNKHFVLVLLAVLLVASMPLSMILPAALAEEDDGNQNGHKNHASDNEKGNNSKGHNTEQVNSSKEDATDTQGRVSVNLDNQSTVGTAILHANGLAIVGRDADASSHAATISLNGVIYRNEQSHYLFHLNGTISVDSTVYQVFAKGSMNLRSGHNLNLLLINGKASNGANQNLAMRFIVLHDNGSTFTIIGDPAGRVGIHTKLYALVGKLTLSLGAGSSGGGTGSGTLDHFQISGIGNQLVGRSFDFTVSAIANNGNVKTNYTGTVKVNTNDGSSPSGDQTDFTPLSYTFGPSDNGVHSFSAKMFNAMHGVYVNVTGSGKTGTSNTFDVSPAPVATVTVTPSSVTLAPNGTATFKAKAFDPFSNPIPDQIFLWSESIGSVGTLSAGTNSSVELLRAPIPSSGASGTVIATASGTNISDSSSVTVNATAIFLDHFTISHVANQTSGQQFSFIVTAIDNLGHTMAGFNGQVNMTTTDGESPLGNSSIINPSSYVFQGSDSGQHIFTATLYKAANGITITASSMGKTGTSNEFNVTHAAISRVHVAPANITLVANATTVVSANATDAYGNPVISNFGWSLSSAELGTITPSGDTHSASIKAANVHTKTTGMLNVTASGTLVSTQVPVAVNV